MLGAYALSAGYYDAYYAKAQRVRTLLIEDLKKAFEFYLRFMWQQAKSVHKA